MTNLKDKRLFLLDMDGTLYLDDNLFDGTIEFLEHIKKIGGKYIFMTNNSSKSVDKYIEKLKKFGIESEKDDFLTSTDAAVLYLKKKNYGKIYAFGTKSFSEQLHGAQLPVTNVLSDDIDCLCMGFDTELTFEKLENACILLNRNVDYIATNPDWVCPTWYGYVPDCGSVAQMLYNATKRKPKFIGKPQPEMALLAMEKFDYKNSETVVIGDRIYTDIACGVNADITSVLVLSGETKLSDVKESDVKPDFVFDNIKKIYAALLSE